MLLTNETTVRKFSQILGWSTLCVCVLHSSLVPPLSSFSKIKSRNLAKIQHKFSQPSACTRSNEQEMEQLF